MTLTIIIFRDIPAQNVCCQTFFDKWQEQRAVRVNAAGGVRVFNGLRLKADTSLENPNTAPLDPTKHAGPRTRTVPFPTVLYHPAHYRGP